MLRFPYLLQFVPTELNTLKRMRRHPLAVTIVVLGTIIALAVLAARLGPAWLDGRFSPSRVATSSPIIRPISAADHILGNPAAPVAFLEYGDFECPFCQEYHPEILAAVESLGREGQVALSYRHFPNSEKHPRARAAAIASECVATLLGNEAFFDYADGLYANSPASLSDEALLASAVGLGAEEDAFRQCLASSAPASRVDADYREGLLLAANDPNFGTPYTVALAADGRQVPFAGSRPASYLVSLAKILLGNATSTAAAR